MFGKHGEEVTLSFKIELHVVLQIMMKTGSTLEELFTIGRLAV